MSKQVTGAYNYGNKLKDAVMENRIASLLITATTLAAEFFEGYFLWFFGLTVFYIVFDRIARLWELPHIKDIDESETKKDVIEKQEYVRGQVLLSRNNMVDRESQVNTAVMLKLLKNAEDIEEVGDDYANFVQNQKVYGQKLDDITSDIEIPFQRFLMKDENVPTTPTTVVAKQKFDTLEVLKEK